MTSRNSISLDETTASIAEAAYGIPDWIKDKAYSYLDEPLKDVVIRWENRIKAYQSPVRQSSLL